MLTPGRYVGAEARGGRRRAVRGEDEAARPRRCASSMAEAAKLDAAIAANLKELGMPKPPPVRPSNTEVRRIMLQYFYDRNDHSTSARGKKGSAVRISDVKAELKASHGLSQQEVQSNLTYLLSQGWVEDDEVQKTFTSQRGTAIPSTTTFYRITAAGIDRIEGEGEFTMPKFHGIKIEATGQNIITLGDGNQINQSSVSSAPHSWSFVSDHTRPRR